MKIEQNLVNSNKGGTKTVMRTQLIVFFNVIDYKRNRNIK